MRRDECSGRRVLRRKARDKPVEFRFGFVPRWKGDYLVSRYLCGSGRMQVADADASSMEFGGTTNGEEVT